jgi:hypothetical protein
MPKTKKRAKPAPSNARVNKSAWIRSQSASTPAKEIVDLAKRQGIQLSLAQVYTARSTAKHGAGGGGGSVSASPVGRRATRTTSTSSASETNSEATFRRLVMAIGVDRAEQYLRDLRQDLGLR